MMNRRDLMKYFGAGAIIAPAGIAEPLVQLVKPAEVRLAEPPKPSVPINLKDILAVDVNLRLKDGTTRHIEFGPYDTQGQLSIRPGDELKILLQRVEPWSPAWSRTLIEGWARL